MGEKNEYEIGNQLSEAYFKGMWAAISIFIPVCFGLIGVSYASVELLKSEWIFLVPLALSSILLYGFGMSFVSRYAGYNKAIFERLWDIEKDNGMNLHRHIKEKGEERRIKWTIRQVKWVLFAALIATWIFRLKLAPLA